MSRYKGNGDTCEHCGATYGELRTGFTYRDVWLLLGWNPPGTPRDEWKRKSRGLVLGHWFQIKQEMWTLHLEECEAQARFERAERRRKK